jgi:hypothetical protein
MLNRLFCRLFGCNMDIVSHGPRWFTSKCTRCGNEISTFMLTRTREDN